MKGKILGKCWPEQNKQNAVQGSTECVVCFNKVNFSCFDYLIYKITLIGSRACTVHARRADVPYNAPCMHLHKRDFNRRGHLLSFDSYYHVRVYINFFCAVKCSLVIDFIV